MRAVYAKHVIIELLSLVSDEWDQTTVRVQSERLDYIPKTLQ